MSLPTVLLYLVCLALALSVSFALTPVFRIIAIRMGEVDRPTEIKTHKIPTPLFGGAAVFIAFSFSLVCIRLLTSFPTGTLHDLRAIMLGGAGMFLLGLVDDLKKPAGLGVRTKFIFQFLIAGMTVNYGFGIHFLTPEYLADIISVVWIVGVSNAFNLIDIMDGLSSSQIVICSLGFLMISFPSEAVYVNFASAALAGAALGFIPWNMSDRRKIFMGDSGSLFCGYVMSVIALGATYTDVNPLGVYAPLLVLSVPVFDTVFVSVLRMGRGMSPFRGSLDHFALRLEKTGISRKNVVLITSGTTIVLCVAACVLTLIPLKGGIFLLSTTVLAILLAAFQLSKIRME